jgi:predicted CoA-binding protein
MQLDPLVKTRSVAIVGATDRVGPGRSVIESLGAIGFTGAIYPVNPKYQTVRNLVCYPSLTDLPEAPDVVVFSIRKPLLLEQVQLAAKTAPALPSSTTRASPSLAKRERANKQKSPAFAAKPACPCVDRTAWASSIRPRAQPPTSRR